MPYLLLQSLTDFLVLVMCNIHISSHPLNKQQEQITLPEGKNSDFIFWMEITWSPLCCHGNVMKLCGECNNCTKFQFYTKKSSEIFHFLWFYIILSFKWRGPGAHCVAMEMSQWKYHETLCWLQQLYKVSVLYRKSLRRYSIFCDVTLFCVHNVTSLVI